MSESPSTIPADRLLRDLLTAYPDAAALRKQLGITIRDARLRCGLTLDGLCAASDVSKPYLSMIENGIHTPSAEKVQRIATALELDAARLEYIADLSTTPASVLQAIRGLVMPAATDAESERAA